MRTSEARYMRDKAIRGARKQGHNVTLISKSGAIELYGCLNNCDAIMDIWDSPAIVNGSMAEVRCPDGGQSSSPWMAIATLSRRVSKYFYHRARKFLTYHNGKEKWDE
jgi:hypothetical protein